eukprot:COSAG04_NODE_1301_length_7315_cov_12.447755_7_plen_241_part_00
MTTMAAPGAVARVSLGATNTVVHFRDGSIVSDFDLRLEVVAEESAQPQSLTLTTAGGEAFVVRREDAGSETGATDPAHGLEVNRTLELGGERSVWGLSVIACAEWSRLGDGVYTLALDCAEGARQELRLAYSESDGATPLPWPDNPGFASPAWDPQLPLRNPVTFEWAVDDAAQRSAVYFAPQGGGEAAEREAEFGAETRRGSFGPHAHPPGPLEIELAVTTVRSAELDGGVPLEITKGT